MPRGNYDMSIFRQRFVTLPWHRHNYMHACRKIVVFFFVDNSFNVNPALQPYTLVLRWRYD